MVPTLSQRGLDLDESQHNPHPKLPRWCAALDAAGAAGLIRGMNDTPDERAAAKRKLIGRAMVIGLLLLVAVYAAATFLGRR